MHPSTTHQIALENQRRMLDQAAADRLARIATAGRPSIATRILQAVRGARPAAQRSERRPATTSQA